MTDDPFNLPLTAEAFFAASLNYYVMEERLGDALLEACGIDPNVPTDWPVGDITFDDYDDSFEFHGVRVGWMPTPEQLTACFAFGFARCWVCYTDHTERYFSPGYLDDRGVKPSHHGGAQDDRRQGRVLRLRMEAARKAFEQFTIDEVHRFGGIPTLTPSDLVLREALAALFEVTA